MKQKLKQEIKGFEKNKWTYQEVLELKEKYGKIPIKDLCLLFDRTKDSIKGKARNIKLMEEKPRWTEEEISILKENYLNKTSKEIGIILRKKSNSIRMKMIELGLKNNKESISKKIIRTLPKLEHEKARNWKGGRIITKEGYIWVYSPNHPYKTTKGYVHEHRLVVENFIRRYLNKEEVIHHINGIKTDNDINNLMIFENSSEHQKFHLKIKQFGYTNPIKRQIANRWNKYLGVTQ